MFALMTLSVTVCLATLAQLAGAATSGKWSYSGKEGKSKENPFSYFRIRFRV